MRASREQEQRVLGMIEQLEQIERATMPQARLAAIPTHLPATLTSCCPALCLLHSMPPAVLPPAVLPPAACRAAGGALRAACRCLPVNPTTCSSSSLTYQSRRSAAP